MNMVTCFHRFREMLFLHGVAWETLPMIMLACPEKSMPICSLTATRIFRQRLHTGTPRNTFLPILQKGIHLIQGWIQTYPIMLHSELRFLHLGRCLLL